MLMGVDACGYIVCTAKNLFRQLCIYLLGYAYVQMSSSSSSVLVWSIESVLLGLWALVLSSYSTPFHVFIARSHVLISSFTLLLHLFIKARDLVVGSAVSQAFVCAVSSLFLSYVSMMVFYAMGPFDKSGSKVNYFSVDGLDDVSVSRSKYFKLPLVGLLTLDACVGLAWFVAAFISSLGMAFSFTGKQAAALIIMNQKDESEEEEVIHAKKICIMMMFHPYGVHLLVMLPCLFIMILVNGGVGAVGSLLLLTYVIAWGAYVLVMYLNIIIYGQHNNDIAGWYGMLYYVTNQLFTKCFLTGVTLLSYLLQRVSLSFEHEVIMLTLLAVSVFCSFDVLSLLSFIVVNIWAQCFGIELQLPTMDSFFGREWEEAHATTTNKKKKIDTESHHWAASSSSSSELPITNNPVGRMGSIFNISPQISSNNNNNRSYKLIDPAAVNLNQWQPPAGRAKIV